MLRPRTYSFSVSAEGTYVTWRIMMLEAMSDQVSLPSEAISTLRSSTVRYWAEVATFAVMLGLMRTADDMSVYLFSRWPIRYQRLTEMKTVIQTEQQYSLVACMRKRRLWRSEGLGNLLILRQGW